MSELLLPASANKPAQRQVAVDSSEESVDSDLDSDGFDRNDPYAAMAKKINKRKRMAEEFNNKPLVQVSNKILENRENMTYFEKHVLKYVFLVGLLAYLIYSNILNAPIVSDKDGSKSAAITSSWSFVAMFADMQRELVMFTLAIGGYIVMASINNYLDRKEQEEEAL